MRLAFIISLALVYTSAFAEDRTARLHEATETIRYVWKEWMENGQLKYDPIAAPNLPKLHGNWTATYTDDDEQVALDFVVRADGTWSSKAFWPDMKDKGYWYLAEGMIVLVDGKIEDDSSDLATAIILRKDVFYVLNADAPKGIIPLNRTVSKGPGK
jgi:hypothetical protein